MTALPPFFPFFYFACVVLHFSFRIGKNWSRKEEKEREKSELRESGKPLQSEGDDEKAMDVQRGREDGKEGDGRDATTR